MPDDATTRYVTEDYVKSVALGAIPTALVPSDVEKASAESGDWKRLTGTVYMAVKDELWISGQIVMRGKLWEHAVKLAHEGHQGTVCTKIDYARRCGGPTLTNKWKAL